MAQTDTESGILVPCPCCGEADATVTLNLADATTFSCQDCGADFTREDVETVLRRWKRVLAWLDVIPTRDQLDE